MPLTLVTGPANAGKAGLVLDAHRAAAARDPLLVVPTRQDALRFERELALGGTVLGGRVVAVSELADELARAVGLTIRRIGRLGRERLLASVAAGSAAGPLAASIGTPGFAAALAGLVSELERAMIEPGRLVRHAPDPATAQLATLYAAYRHRLDRLGLEDRDGHLWRALDALRAQPARWGARPVFLYGFDDLTRAERDAVETLSGPAGAEVWVSLAFEPGHPALEGRASTYQELRALGARERRLQARPAYYQSDARDALHGLERRLFAPGPGELMPGPAVTLLEAGGARAEAELLAAWLLTCMSEGMRPGELCIAVRHPEACRTLLAGVLDAYGIPHAIDAETPLAHTPLGRALLGGLRVAVADAVHAAAAAADGTPTATAGLPADAPPPATAPLPADATDLLAWVRLAEPPRDLAVLDRVDAALRRRGARSAREARRELERLAPGLPLSGLDALATAAGRGPRALLDGVVRAAERLLSAPRRRAAALLTGTARSDARAYAAALAAVEELRTLTRPGGAPAGGPALIEALAAVPVRLAEPPGPDRVTVCDPLRVRARRFRALAIAGLQQGELPRPTSPDGLLDDERRRALLAAGVPLRPPEDPLGAERALFSALVSRPTARLALAFRTADEEGNPALVSPFVDEVARRFDPPPRRERRSLADVTWAPETAPTPLERARAVAAGGPRRRLPTLGAAVTPGALSALGEIRAVSPGSLECLGGCGVRWLIERWLEPRPLEPDPEPMTQGGLVHAALEHALQARAEHGTPLTPSGLPDALAALHDGLERAAAEARLDPARPADAALVRRARSQGERLLLREAGAPTGFAPRSLEWGFGLDGSAAPALALSGDVAIHGRVDRIDVDRTGRAAVIDYKASGGPAHERWAEERRLQPPLYMLAVRELLGLDPVAGLYQPLSRELRPRGISVTGEGPRTAMQEGTETDRPTLAAALEDARARALALVTALRAGRLQADPDHCGPRGCTLPGVCRRSTL